LVLSNKTDFILFIKILLITNSCIKIDLEITNIILKIEIMLLSGEREIDGVDCNTDHA